MDVVDAQPCFSDHQYLPQKDPQPRNSSLSKRARGSLKVATPQSLYKSMKVYRFAIESPASSTQDLKDTYNHSKFKDDFSDEMGLVS